MTALLHVGPGIDLPVDLVTQTTGILARKGAGKTYTAMVMTEELVKAELPVVALDPLGAWWGLRSSADGQRGGLPITILGGEHGDVPLEATAGRLIAELVAEQGTSFVLDLSSFESNAAQDRFVTDFAERLYRVKAKDKRPLHLMVVEADSFAPQRPQPGQQRMLGAFEAIVRRGRIRGLGVTLITQRPAVLNKNVLTQIELLITLQMTAPQDRAAIDEWVRGNGTREQRDELMGSLASLQKGEAWFWSPAWLDLFTKAQVRPRETFDSSRTPEAGHAPIEPRRLAQVDLDALRQRMAETIERAEASDPKRLQKRIIDLERALKKAEDRPPKVERIEVSVGGETSIPARLPDLLEAIRRLSALAETVGREAASPPKHIASAVRSSSPPSVPATAKLPTAEGSTLPKAQRLILSVLAQHGSRTVTQVAMLTGYSGKSGGFRNSLSVLRTNGYIEGRGEIQATADGLAALGAYEPLPTGPELIEYWKSTHLGLAERRIVDVLVAHFPKAVPVPDIALVTGYSAGSGGFRNALSRLRTLELASGRGELTLNPTLMDATA